jgi:hypothetical protein
MHPDGQTYGWLNTRDGLESKGQIKVAPPDHLDRANFKWADVSLCSLCLSVIPN